MSGWTSTNSPKARDCRRWSAIAGFPTNTIWACSPPLASNAVRLYAGKRCAFCKRVTRFWTSEITALDTSFDTVTHQRRLLPVRTCNFINCTAPFDRPISRWCIPCFATVRDGPGPPFRRASICSARLCASGSVILSQANACQTVWLSSCRFLSGELATAVERISKSCLSTTIEGSLPASRASERLIDCSLISNSSGGARIPRNQNLG